MLVHSNCTHTVSSHLTAVAVASKLLFFPTGYEYGMPLNKMVSPSM